MDTIVLSRRRYKGFEWIAWAADVRLEALIRAHGWFMASCARSKVHGGGASFFFLSCKQRRLVGMDGVSDQRCPWTISSWELSKVDAGKAGESGDHVWPAPVTKDGSKAPSGCESGTGGCLIIFILHGTVVRSARHGRAPCRGRD